MPPVLELQGISFRYPSYPGLASSSLFGGLALELAAGECVRILGGPESGKSTLARIVCGLVPGYSGGVLAGSVRVQGVDVRASRPCDLIELVGTVFQDPDEQLVSTSCSAEVSFALESLGVEPGEIRSRAEEALIWAGLSGYAARNPLTLSGGEKRRLLLACLRSIRPALWVLDETVEELDVQFRGELVRSLREAGTAAVLFASKEMDFPGGALDATYRLEGGRLALASLPGPKGRAPRVACAPPARLPADAPVVLAARDLSFGFQGSDGSFELEVRDLRIAQGEVVALAGPNGAGKTTLARMLCGLVRPRSGELLLKGPGGLAVAGPDELRSSVAYVFQNPDYQLYLPTVREELEFGLLEAGSTPAEREAGIARAIELFRLPPGDAPPALLSYGTRKRLQMAVYYLLPRPVVILDEADSGIGREDFAAGVEAFAARGSSVLFISHDLDHSGRLAHRVLTMERGVLEC